MKTPAVLDTISELRRRSVELKLGFDITSTRDGDVLAMELDFSVS